MKTWNDVDLIVSNNADWDEVIRVGLPGDTWLLVGATPKMQIRNYKDLNLSPDPVATYTSELTVDASGSNRNVKLHVDNADTAKLPPGEYWYDLVLSTTDAKTIVGARGKVMIYAGVTI